MGWLLRLCVLFAAYHPAAPFLQPPLRAAALHGSRTVAGSPALSPAVSAVGSRGACISMGVPKFFRWLTERFPQINVAISEGRRQSDWVDNFYLDMNGIIHQCTHGDEVAPGEKLTEEEMVERIFAYTERLISIARPRKILYLAIDGVAPRAKMNQQRSRRYRVPRELAAEAKRAQANMKAGRNIAPTEDELAAASPPPFDSNCITPGTEFLCKIGKKYQEWIEHKMATDPTWQSGPTVVFSGADVPGEGEHKIMDFIRAQRADHAYAEETRHCMYGLDADLIMLSLVTHEPHFTLLRERQRFQRGRFSPRGGRGRGRGRGPPQQDQRAQDRRNDDDFVFLDIAPLRLCLSGTMRPRLSEAELGFKWDEERAVDDFVFLCMLVGNDFIPSLPHLDVADGALNLMLRTYTDLLPSLGGYLTDRNGEGCILHMARFEKLLVMLSGNEAYMVNKKLAKDSASRDNSRPGQLIAGDNPEDYKRRYYLQKLGLHPSDATGRRALVQTYLDGLVWCLEYYHHGCKSWDWYFEDFYAPLATDLRKLADYEINLKMGKPFPPLAQLLSVLPPQSGELVPKPYKELMLNPESAVYDAFPADFTLDLNGKRNDWEAVALLPFIDEARLLAAVDSVKHQLTEAELARNINSEDVYYKPPGLSGDPSSTPSRTPSSTKPLESTQLPDDDLASMRVPELQQELRQRGLGTSGRKAELVERLRAAME